MVVRWRELAAARGSAHHGTARPKPLRIRITAATRLRLLVAVVVSAQEEAGLALGACGQLKRCKGSGCSGGGS